MNYQPKIVKCRLKTGGKSVEQIRAKYTGQGMVYRDFENIQRANEQFDGLILSLSLWNYDGHSRYHLSGWDPVDDTRMMMAIYYSEQIHPYPQYKNDLEKFKADWKAGTYDPGCSLCFDKEDVEELEMISEEVVPPEPAPPPQKRQKKTHRKK
jgi:hypothetical protein